MLWITVCTLFGAVAGVIGWESGKRAFRAKAYIPPAYVLLGLLENTGWSFGLDLIKKSNRRLRRGTIYVLLTWLEKKGLVCHQYVSEAGARPRRRVYGITLAGRAALATYRVDEENDDG